MLIYIHGFNSSALSFKAAVLRKRMSMLRRTREFVCPELPHRPREAIEMLDQIIAAREDERLALVGSSLGGYYATYLAERHAARAVLVNPAVRPYRLLASSVGPQQNLYTGSRYAFTEAHLQELRALQVDRITADRYLLVVATGDEVLDYRDAIERYRGCVQAVVPGGDHGFADFERHVDHVLAFCGIRDGR
jgi:predicted esterase YcpF (UPF0227 family)